MYHGGRIGPRTAHKKKGRLEAYKNSKNAGHSFADQLVSFSTLSGNLLQSMKILLALLWLSAICVAFPFSPLYGGNLSHFDYHDYQQLWMISCGRCQRSPNFDLRLTPETSRKSCGTHHPRGLVLFKLERKKKKKHEMSKNSIVSDRLSRICVDLGSSWVIIIPCLVHWGFLPVQQQIITENSPTFGAGAQRFAADTSLADTITKTNVNPTNE